MIWMLFFMNLWATEVAVQGENTPDIYYEKQLIAHPQRTDFISFEVEQQRKKHADILEELKRAQFHFLKGSLDQAIQHFQRIHDQQHDEDWDLEVRKVIHYSQIRLAQLSQNERQKQWIKSALQFAPDLKLDQSLFPPPLVEKYTALKKMEPLQVWALPKNSNSFSRIFINGREQKKHSQFLRYRQGKVRISFYSNRYLPIHLVVKTNKLEGHSLDTVPIAQGECGQINFNHKASAGVQFHLVDSDCNQPLRAKSLASTTTPTKLASPPENGRKRSFFKSKWFWIGASVLATGLAYQAIQNNRSSAPASPPPPPRPIEISNQ